MMKKILKVDVNVKNVSDVVMKMEGWLIEGKKSVFENGYFEEGWFKGNGVYEFIMGGMDEGEINKIGDDRVVYLKSKKEVVKELLESGMFDREDIDMDYIGKFDVEGGVGVYYWEECVKYYFYVVEG